MFAGRTDTTLPVIDSDGRYLGTLSSHDVLDALAAADPTDVVALTIDTAPVGEAATFGDVLRRFDSGGDAVPVAGESGALIGWVRQRDVLAALAPTDPGPRPIPAAPAPTTSTRPPGRDAALSS
jgi:CIC family chloride channel protein